MESENIDTKGSSEIFSPVLLHLTPFYRWEIWSSERLNGHVKSTQVVIYQTEIWVQMF